ncbi:MAG: hypothetical protein HUU35_08430 [Armatimonadetes bacterium]|nr:hypothetical protein [Armatimonadota bacterium]
MARPAPAPELTCLELRGKPYAMGLAHGEELRPAIQQLCEERVDLTIAWAARRGRQLCADELLGAMEPFLVAHQRYAPAVWDELEGIAAGAAVSLEALLIGNGYTDIRDTTVYGVAAPGHCTTFSALGEATADGEVYVGQTWDMDLAMLPHVIACRRRPTDGPETLAVTTAGCLSLIGVNEHGLAVGNSNVTPRDARPGVMYLALIHQALAQADLAAATGAIAEAERASGHHYYLADARNAVHLEVTATRVAELPRDGVCHTQSNDYRHPSLADLAVPPLPGGRSVERRCRLAEELAARGPLTVEAMQASLEAEGVRVDPPVDRVVSCAAAVLHPAGRRMWVTHGPPRPGHWHGLAL